MTLPKENLNVFLSDIVTPRPRFETLQKDGLQWIAAAHARSEENQAKARGEEFSPERYFVRIKNALERFGCDPSRIQKRGHELKDFLHGVWNEMEIFDVDSIPAGKGMEQRMAVFAEASERVFSQLYLDSEEPPQNLIHVTCTGYTAPSAAQRQVNAKRWHGQTTVTHAYHMGCYASIPALRMARGFLRDVGDLNARTDIVHTELCTLHMNPSIHTAEQLVVQSLFADGHAKYSLSFENEKNQGNIGFRILALHEKIVPESTSAMGWTCTDWGMRMSLSKDVPQLIGAGIKEFLKELFLLCEVNIADVSNSILYAIHPGGPKIIDGLQDLLKIDDERVHHSRKVLFQFGNMSSATLPHVWKDILEDPNVQNGTFVVSLAFGPGLTMCGAVFQVVR